MIPTIVALLFCNVVVIEAQVCNSTLDSCRRCDGSNDCIGCSGSVSNLLTRDFCGVCGGDGSSCLRCRFDQRDECGVCFGRSESCRDCRGTPNGPFRLDACGICGGPNAEACVDCSGDPDGSRVYDRCGVCGGDDTSCLDCAGALQGTKIVDRCGVCGGDNACVDCAGVVRGLATYDRCDVCDGKNKSCRDCAGELHGTRVVDACGECVLASELLDEHGHTTQCALDRLERDIDNSLGLYLTVVFIALLALFFLVLLCVHRTRRFWYGLFWAFESAALRKAEPPERSAPRSDQQSRRSAVAAISNGR